MALYDQICRSSDRLQGSKTASYMGWAAVMQVSAFVRITKLEPKNEQKKRTDRAEVDGVVARANVERLTECEPNQGETARGE